jgi:toxin ParE1/3/4
VAGRVVWTEAAALDLEQAAEFIARDSPRYAAAFVREVRDAARSLMSFALRGRQVPELADPDLRELIVRSYRLIYHVAPGTTSILGLIHGARDLPAVWRPKDREPDDSPS